MNRPTQHIHQCAFLIVLALTLGTSDTSVRAGDLMPPYVASQLEMTQAWSRTVSAPAGSQSIVDMQLFVHEKDPIEYIEVVATKKKASPGEKSKAAEVSGSDQVSDQDEVLVRINTDRHDLRGNPIGKAEAERLAGNEVRRLKRRGIGATMRSTEVRRVRLYTLSDDGTLEARDAETGQPVWIARVGDRRLPYGQIGVSEDHLSVINGSNFIQVDAVTGEAMVELRTIHAPKFGAINAGDYALVSNINGGIEAYPLADPAYDNPFTEIVAGRPLASPTKSPDSSRVAWGTDRGFVYCMELTGTPSTLFRLGTDGIVGGRLASASGDRFFFGSESGQVYGLRATRSGKVMWSHPYAEPFYDEPLVVDDRLYILSRFGNLFCLDVKDGSMVWDAPIGGFQKLVAGFGDRVFLRNFAGGLAVIDREGKRVGSYQEIQPKNVVRNILTDRLYLVDEVGMVQCMRPTSAILPNFSTQPDAKPAFTEQEDEGEAGSMAEATPFDKNETTPFPAGNDPFGPGAADPFGAGAADPFGAGAADPFGGGGGAAMDDPFGGDDPFGN